MKLNFRQGIIRYQTDITNQPTFLKKSSLSGDYVDLNVSPDPTVITFAHYEKDYTYEETKYVENAWGPFQPLGQTQYLYWELDYLTGQIKRSFSLLSPVSGNTSPISNPQVDQHWFDTSNKVMKVWNGNSWVVKIRVFAGRYDSNAILVPNLLGSSVGLNEECKSGLILFNDRGEPLKDARGRFITSESTILTHGDSGTTPTTTLHLETYIKHVEATEYIPKYSAVSLVGKNKIALGSYNNVDRLIIGLVEEDMYSGEVARLITSGRIFNEQWNWPDHSIGKPIFCGVSGQITTVPPQVGISQMIGVILSDKEIDISVQMPIIL